MYNGYPTQDDFHKALQAGMAEYAEAREKGMRENPEGWAHADCDHAYGICSAGAEKPSPEWIAERQQQNRALQELLDSI